MKKNLFAASAIAIAMGMASCSDYFLDLNPTDQQTEANFYKTPEEFEAAAIVHIVFMVLVMCLKRSMVLSIPVHIMICLM